MAATGTLASAAPALPVTSKRTCQDPCAIIQTEPVKNAESSADRFMTSGVGGCFEASPVSGIGVMRRLSTGEPVLRASIVATPGITLGMRIVTNSL